VFLSVVFTVVVILGAAMFAVEGPESGFTSIPESMYWAIVTLTTVGYGDIAPVTFWGKLIAAVVMILGYSLIIVPTGIISAEVVVARVKSPTTQACPECMREGHDKDASHCKFCGAAL
jgi:voltage-gated potassium channel